MHIFGLVVATVLSGTLSGLKLRLKNADKELQMARMYPEADGRTRHANARASGEFGIWATCRTALLILLTFVAILFQMGRELRGETIEGRVVVQKRLTRPRVTASLPLYQRGPGVALPADAPGDPLSFERAHVAVYLEGTGNRSRAGSVASAVTEAVSQENRRFAQDFVVVPVGSTVSFPNGDPVFHNVFSLSKSKSFDLGNYPRGETRTVLFNEPGIVLVNCHLHANMSAVIVVTPNRWYGRPDASGQFRLRDVPPGSYTIVAWHKAVGFFRKRIEVVAGAGASVEFFLPVAENGVVSGQLSGGPPDGAEPRR